MALDLSSGYSAQHFVDGQLAPGYLIVEAAYTDGLLAQFMQEQNSKIGVQHAPAHVVIAAGPSDPNRPHLDVKPGDIIHLHNAYMDVCDRYWRFAAIHGQYVIAIIQRA